MKQSNNQLNRTDPSLITAAPMASGLLASICLSVGHSTNATTTAYNKTETPVRTESNKNKMKGEATMKTKCMITAPRILTRVPISLLALAGGLAMVTIPASGASIFDHRPLVLAPADASAAAGGGAGEAGPSGQLSANEAAKQLANPNSPLASLTLKSQWRHWKGDLPGADGRDSGTLLFQPTFPFALNKTDTLFFRPAFNYQFDQPYFDSGSGRVRGRSGFGDMGFDIAYGRTAKSGFLAAVGMVGSVPIGARQLSSRTWGLGPEVFVGLFRKWGVVGVFPNHVWNVGGPNDISMTTIQPAAVFLPGKGWSVGTAGMMTYDWRAEQWTVPIQLQVSKTVKIGKMPVKFALEGNYYVERSDRLGPEWMVGFNITPVVPNVFAKLFGEK